MSVTRLIRFFLNLLTRITLTKEERKVKQKKVPLLHSSIKEDLQSVVVRNATIYLKNSAHSPKRRIWL